MIVNLQKLCSLNGSRGYNFEYYNGDRKSNHLNSYSLNNKNNQMYKLNITLNIRS